GFRRLSIIDLGPGGHQPMLSSDGRHVIVLNGEIYNYRLLKRELEEADVRFRSESDTEVLLAGISHWGLEETLRRANGMFAFALWDRTGRTLRLARDRMGQKPLYCGWSKGVFLFGSEIKALEKHPAFALPVDRDALALFFRHGYLPAPHSIYQGIRKLLPGTVLTMSAESLERGEIPPPVPYWSAADAARAGVDNPFGGTAGEAADRLEALMKDAVELCMIADVPVGAFLSGGIDSSAIAGVMQSLRTKPVKTFSIGFGEKQFNEAAHAARVAKHLGTDHTELYIAEKDALSVVPDLPNLYDEPFADSSQIPTHIVSRLAREQVTVSLSGDGGDELFGGYNRYMWGGTLRNVLSALPMFVRQTAVAGMTGVPVPTWNGIARILDPLIPKRYKQVQVGDKVHKFAALLGASGPDDLYLRLVSQWNRPQEVVLGCAEPETPLSGTKKKTALADFRHRMMLLDALVYLPDDILVKVDRASMGVGLESRIPMLDHRLFEFAWSLPLSMKMRKGQNKWILRQVLDRYVPHELIDRPKMGFAVPIARWLRGELRDWAEDLLSEDRLGQEGFLDPGAVRKT
ncbi:MAG: asparagine synthase (glutamine-hydrolyzing), partial [Nitrospinota bacterium]